MEAVVQDKGILRSMRPGTSLPGIRPARSIEQSISTQQRRRHRPCATLGRVAAPAPSSVTATTTPQRMIDTTRNIQVD